MTDFLPGAPYNPRKISPEKLADLGRAMKEFGDLGGIVYNVRTKQLIGGHQRVENFNPDRAIEKTEHADATGTVAIGYVIEGGIRWAYREVDWPEEREIAANIAANRHGGEWDIPKLKELLVSLDDGGSDLSLSGFDEKALEELMAWEAPDLKSDPGEADDEATLKTISFRVTEAQEAMIEGAVEKAIGEEKGDEGGTDDLRGLALYRIAEKYLKSGILGRVFR